MYITFSLELQAGIRSNCIARYPENPSFQTSVLDHPHSMNCINGAETAEPSRIMGKVDYFDKAVTVMSNYVTNAIWANPTPNLGTNTVMTFVGQCSLDHYYKLDFDTKKFVIGDMPTVVAFSSTLTYIFHFTLLNTVSNSFISPH